MVGATTAAATVHGGHASAVRGEPVAPQRFAAAMKDLSYDFFTGVPCSLVSGLIAALEADPHSTYRAPEPDTLLADLEWATAYQREQRLPAALLLRAGVTR